MEIISEKVEDGVVRRRFDLEVEGEVVPGLHWWPEGGSGGPTILFGHGGFQSKEAPNIVEMAESLARTRGWASVALDAPGHGERRTEEQVRQQEETLRRLRDGTTDPAAARRAPRPSATDAPSSTARESREPRMVREWKALLDVLDASDDARPPAYGYWGVSMGARYGIPLVATEPRVRAAVLGLFWLLPDPAFRAAVESITIPILFLFQYHDELMTPESGLKLWDAFGSTEKTVHITPGPPVGIPPFERDSSALFFGRHLTT